jgi:acetyl-CoA synthetase
LESAIDHAEEISETAVVGFPHPIKGEGIACYVVLKEGIEPTQELTNT